MKSILMKAMTVLIGAVLLNACSIISVADTAVDIVLIPVKVGVAVVEVAIPEGDD